MTKTTIGTASVTKRPSRIPHPSTPLAQMTQKQKPSTTTPPSVLIRVHPWLIPLLPRARTVLSLCDKKNPKTHARGGNEPVGLLPFCHALRGREVAQVDVDFALSNGDSLG
jgi:hypothetical protein